MVEALLLDAVSDDDEGEAFTAAKSKHLSKQASKPSSRMQLVRGTADEQLEVVEIYSRRRGHDGAAAADRNEAALGGSGASAPRLRQGSTGRRPCS